MSTGFWFNQDGLPIQFGTQKAIPELGGDYVFFGPNRCFETLISLGATSFGTGALQVPALPSSFSGTSTPIAAGVQSLTSLLPLQVTAPVTAAGTDGVLKIVNPQIYWDLIEVETLVSANAGTGSATGIAIGLVSSENAVQAASSTGAFVQITPNAGTQVINSLLNAQMVAGKKFQIQPDATVLGPSFGSSVSGDWMGNTTNGLQLPKVTNSLTPLPNFAWISAIAAGGTYSGSSGGGLLKLRIHYGVYGVINQ